MGALKAIPAIANGLVGLKASRGLVSMSPSKTDWMDITTTKGWLTRSVQDMAVLMALWQRKSKELVVLYSDRGSQFTSHQYQQFLAGHNITCSMSVVGSCYDDCTPSRHELPIGPRNPPLGGQCTRTASHAIAELPAGCRGLVWCGLDPTAGSYRSVVLF
jgi:hypothetical protein